MITVEHDTHHQPQVRLEQKFPGEENVHLPLHVPFPLIFVFLYAQLSSWKREFGILYDLMRPELDSKEN